MTTAIVVGSGPNGLAAGVTLAQHGVEVTVLEATGQVGGGSRSGELTLPGLVHDHCAAVHPLTVPSPFIKSLNLERHGLAWRRPAVDLAHPLDDGSAGLLIGSVARTAGFLGTDGPSWRRVFEPLSEVIDDLVAEFMQPPVHLPRHLSGPMRFGVQALQPATVLARHWHTGQARALFSGVCAHSFQPQHRPATSALGLLFIAANQRYGWVVAEGGTRVITDALARELSELDGRIETGIRVRRLADLPPADVVILDLMPSAVADLAGDRLPPMIRRAYRRYRHGPGAFKVDLAVQDGIPWTNPHCRSAGTVHVGGTMEEVVHAERLTNQGRMPQRPFVLVGQQYLADPGRSAGNVHPIWCYAHVPHGFSGDATEAILDQIERFAPGFRERILARTVTSTAQLARYNANFIGGDIMGGATTPAQIVSRPRVAIDPYATGIPGIYICSAATPPGAGLHGMGGRNAARSALRHLGRPRRGPAVSRWAGRATHRPA